MPSRGRDGNEGGGEDRVERPSPGPGRAESPPEFEIPYDRLPDGFAATLGRIAEAPAAPRPAATIVLVRPGPGGPEVLLVRRNRTVGFVPGAYVFPGGRVDASDGSDALLGRMSGLSRGRACERLRILDGTPPAHAYYVAALREAFEETGILVCEGDSGTVTAARDAAVHAARLDLLDGRRTFLSLLGDLDAILDGAAMEYIAHWITPAVEPRRYDTRFFAVRVDSDTPARPDGREIVEAVWLTPAAALVRNAAGSMPMVFPTLKTLASLADFASVDAVFDSFGRRAIPAILPRLVRTSTGVGIELPDPAGEAGEGPA